MPPVAASQHSVYCALPGRIRPRSLLSVALMYAAAPGPVHDRLAEVADVEDADGLADRGVLLDHAGGVLERHGPAAELGELGPEGDVPVVQRGGEQGGVVHTAAEPIAAVA